MACPPLPLPLPPLRSLLPLIPLMLGAISLQTATVSALLTHPSFREPKTEFQDNSGIAGEATMLEASRTPALMLRLGNSTLDSTKSFRVPPPEPSLEPPPDPQPEPPQPGSTPLSAPGSMAESSAGSSEMRSPASQVTRSAAPQVARSAAPQVARSAAPQVVWSGAPEVVRTVGLGVASHVHLDHDKRFGPTFENLGGAGAVAGGREKGGGAVGNVTLVTAQAGDDVLLNCRISLLQDKTVSWVRRRQGHGQGEGAAVADEAAVPELLTVGGSTYAADERISVGARYPGNWRLSIRDARPSDSALYHCQISTHPPRAAATLLTVNSPAVWVEDEGGRALRELYVEAGSTLALWCRARRLPVRRLPAHLLWLHHARPLNTDITRGGISVRTEQVGGRGAGGADSVLRVARLGKVDAGAYSCVVPGAPNLNHTLQVHVLNESLAELHGGAARAGEGAGASRLLLCIALGVALLHPS